MDLHIDSEKCIRCGRCVEICPSMVFGQKEKRAEINVLEPQNCIVCGHCVGVCPAGAVVHSDFPVDKVHVFDYCNYPTAEQLLLLCRARRSNRAFSEQAVPDVALEQIIEAAHRAPTASNLQQVEFTIVTDPAHLRLITTFTLEVFKKILRKLKNPLLRPLIKLIMPDALRYEAVFERILREDCLGNDLILRKAKAVILIHTPRTSRFGCQDANLAYQNASLMAECLGINEFYTGFVCSAIQQKKKGSLEKALGIEGRIQAGMALGMPAFRFKNYIDRKEVCVKKI